MARRTPLEVAIAAQTEKQGRYEAKMRAAGLTKVCAWVPIANAEAVKDLARQFRLLHENPRADPP